MKKVKIMLMSMAVIAIIGGALAFKAKYNQIFCTLTAIPVGNTFTYTAGLECQPLINVKTTNLPINPAFTTPVADIADCPDVTCTTFTYTTKDNQ